MCDDDYYDEDGVTVKVFIHLHGEKFGCERSATRGCAGARIMAVEEKALLACLSRPKMRVCM
jgi:hypothetical protein